VIIAGIGREAAMPFIDAYCKRWGLPLYEHGAQHADWFGAFHCQGLRGVLGLISIPEMDGIFVHGLYAEDSKYGKLAVSRMIKLLDRIPKTLHGAIFLPNLDMLKIAVKHGWEIENVVIGDRQIHIRRAA